MKINLKEMVKLPSSSNRYADITECLCQYNNLKYIGTYSVYEDWRDGLTKIRVPVDVDDLLSNKGFIGYTDGEILMIPYLSGIQIFVKNPA